jgi:hypothetical protein
MIDTNTPDFKVLSAGGRIINSPLNASKESFRYVDAGGNYTEIRPDVGNHVVQVSGFYGSLLDVDPLHGASLQFNVARPVNVGTHQSLSAQKARLAISPILAQSLVAVAELHKTVSLLESALKSLALIARGARSGNWSLVLRGIKGQKFDPNQLRSSRTLFSKMSKGKDQSSSSAAASRWLELRYGWTPLVMDIQGIMKALASRMAGYLPRHTARGHSSSTVISEKDFSEDYAGYGTQSFHFVISHEVKCRAYCLFAEDLTTRSYRDFGIVDLPLAAWELVPFSFVIDWFVNVGNWIEAITPKLGVTILAEGVVTTDRVFVTRVISGWTPFPTGGSFSQSGLVGHSSEYELLIKKRDPSLSLHLRRPVIDVKINVKRSVDALALIRRMLVPSK